MRNILLKKSIFTVLSLCAFWIAGCDLSTAPECAIGQKKCSSGDAGNGILSVCGADNAYHNISCYGGCNETGNDCEIANSAITCDTAGKLDCVSTQDLSMNLTCIDNQWISSICGSGDLCGANACSTVQDSCTGNEQSCSYIESLKLSVAVSCSHGKWMVQYCPNEVGCNGSVCCLRFQASAAPAKITPPVQQTKSKGRQAGQAPPVNRVSVSLPNVLRDIPCRAKDASLRAIAAGLTVSTVKARTGFVIL